MKKSETTKGAEAPKVKLQPLPEPTRERVAYDLVRPDPDQPRKTFDEGGLKSLAESIRERGVLQDLTLEFMPPQYQLLEPDLECKNWRVKQITTTGEWRVEREGPETFCREFLNKVSQLPRVDGMGKVNHFDPLNGYYRIVCGERRWRAAGMVGLTELPARVYTGLTPEQRFALQMIENNQRENVSALEESAALSKQLEERRKMDAGFSAEALAAEVGLSRAAFYERLKLNRLQPVLREALIKGTISVSMAGEIAKLPTPKLQEKLLKQIVERNQYSPVSVRLVQQWLDGLVKQLDEAPFDLRAENCIDPESQKGIVHLPEDCFVVACTACPHRTGNMLLEFPDLKGRPNVCTLPDCYEAKVKAHWLKEAKDQAQKGVAVLTEKEFKTQRGELAPGDEWLYTPSKNGTVTDLLGKHAPEPVLVATANGLEKYFRKTDLPAAFKTAKVPVPKSADVLATPESKAKSKETAEAERLVGERREVFVKQQLKPLAKALKGLSTQKSWEIVESVTSHYFGDDDFEEALMNGVKEARLKVLGYMFGQHGALDYQKDWDEDGMKIWKLAGIDLKAEFAKAEKEGQAALPMAKGDAKQKEFVQAMSGVQTKLKAAADARWAKIHARDKAKKKA